MDDRPDFAVIVVSYNTRSLLLECLSSVVECAKHVSLELVIVDNASEDGSYEAVCEFYPKAIAIRNSTNVGFGAACNQGIKATRSPFILLLNSDARITIQTLETLRNHLEKNELCGAAGCRLTNFAGVEVVTTRNFLTPLNQALEMAGIKVSSRRLRRTYPPSLRFDLVDCSVDWIVGACVILRRAAINQIGLFDEEFFMYSEDEDLCFRLRKSGWQVCFCGGATAIHHGAASSSQNRTEMLRQFYLSQMLFLSKHRGPRSVSIFVAAMKGVLVLKRFLLMNRNLREKAREHLIALREACVLASKNKRPVFPNEVRGCCS